MKKTTQLAYSALFTALIALCAWVSVPMPVPFTLQTLAVFLCASLQKPKWAAASVAAYIALGALGLPVFSNFRGGLGMLLGPTGGFILGFLPAAFVCSLLVRKFGKNALLTGLCMALSQLIVYACGVAGFLPHSPNGLQGAIALCVLPFLAGDAAKILVAALLRATLKKHMRFQETE